MGVVFVRVIKANFSKSYRLRVPHGFQDYLLVLGAVILGEMRMAPESTPDHLLTQKSLPQPLSLRQAWVTEVRHTAAKISREAAAVLTPKALERSTEAQLPVQHVQVAVGVNEPKGLSLSCRGRVTCTGRGHLPCRCLTVVKDVT